MYDIAFCGNMLNLIFFFGYGPWSGVRKENNFFNSDDKIHVLERVIDIECVSMEECCDYY